MSDATPPVVLTDAKGRKLTLRKITVLEQVRMLRAIGPAQSENQPYFQMVECACMVAQIDELPMMMPNNEQQIDAVISRLGDEGMSAVMVSRIAEVQAARDAAEAAAGGVAAAPASPLPLSD
jgi:hypothetical protein